MKSILLFTTISLIFNLYINNSNAQTDNIMQSDRLEKLWSTPDVLTTSESVCYDAKQNVIYVSCINGNPVDKDNNGFIAMLSLEGKLISLNWITGLNAPKGMGIFNDRLYVTDIDKIIEIDIPNSLIIGEYPVKDARFLNDITIDPEGNVYISDMATNKIHLLKDGKTEKWLEDDLIIKPNGLFYENGDILIGCSDGIFAVRISDKKTWHIIKNTGGIDGLESDGKGNYIISDWMGKIQLVNSDKKPVTLLNTTDAGMNAADIEFIPGRNTLLVPTFSDNRVVGYRLISE